MGKEHHYTTQLTWTDSKGNGTTNYEAYSRDHLFSAAGKPDIPGTADPAFRGDPFRYNPEELLVQSLSACHLLTYLYLCSINNIVVVDYRDEAKGVMKETNDGGGRFSEVTLYPIVTVTDSAMVEKARHLHQEAGKLCYIANSCNFPIHHEPEIRVVAPAAN